MSVERIPLIGSLSDRLGTGAKDIILRNCYVEAPLGKEGGLFLVAKRPGLVEVRDLTDGQGRGLWEFAGNEYALVGNQLYKNGSAMDDTIGTSTGFVSADEADESSRRLVFGDGSTIYYFEDATTEIDSVSSNEPASFIATSVNQYDGYTFVATTEADLWNSDSLDITTWGASANIRAEARGDAGVGAFKFLDYLAVLGEKSLEFFWNSAGSPSPLSSYQGATSKVGAPAGTSQCGLNIGDDYFFVGQLESGSRAVYMLKKSFEPQKVSNQHIDSLLEAEGTNITNAWAFAVTVAGKTLYCLSLPTTADVTVVYDTELNLWYEWQIAGDGHMPVIGQAGVGGQRRTLHRSTGQVLQWSDSTKTDDGSNFDMVVQTTKWDGQTKQVKFVSDTRIIGDIQSSTANVGVQWTDDDYQNLNTSRNIDMSDENSKLTRCGSFVRRAWKLTYTGALDARWEAVEINSKTGHYARN